MDKDQLREEVARAIYIAEALDGKVDGNRDHIAAVFGATSQPDYRHYGRLARAGADAVLSLPTIQKALGALARDAAASPQGTAESTKDSPHTGIEQG